MDFDEDRDAKIARRIEDQARATADGAAAAASDAEKALGDVINDSKDLRKKIMSGVVSADDARRAGRAAAAPQGGRRSRPVHQDRVRRCRQDHRRPGGQGRRAEDQVRELPAVS